MDDQIFIDDEVIENTLKDLNAYKNINSISDINKTTLENHLDLCFNINKNSNYRISQETFNRLNFELKNLKINKLLKENGVNNYTNEFIILTMLDEVYKSVINDTSSYKNSHFYYWLCNNKSKDRSITNYLMKFRLEHVLLNENFFDYLNNIFIAYTRDISNG